VDPLSRVRRGRSLHSTEVASMDVVMCVGSDDIAYLFPHALKLCRRNLPMCDTIHLVSPEPARVTQAIRDAGIDETRLELWHDEAILTPQEAALAGWLRQQIIKLRADSFCRTPEICCIGADTLILRPIGRSDIFYENEPIIYYNRYPYPNPHLEYERRRVASVANLLRAEPQISHLLGDFITDLTVFKAAYLSSLRTYLERKYGPSAFIAVAPHRTESFEDKQSFGEWTMYAVYVLDVLRAEVPVRNSRSRFVYQIHSAHDLADALPADTSIVHIVSKTFALDTIAKELAAHGLTFLVADCEAH
jgi:Family of unknown function (DUF6492)